MRCARDWSGTTATQRRRANQTGNNAGEDMLKTFYAAALIGTMISGTTAHAQTTSPGQPGKTPTQEQQRGTAQSVQDPSRAMNTQSGSSAQADMTSNSNTSGMPPANGVANRQATNSANGTGSVRYVTQNDADIWRASKLDGVEIYNDQNEKIGDISDVLIGRNGKVRAVVIGVGGFLGIGERNVAWSRPYDLSLRHWLWFGMYLPS
jgi:hypothetical protein